MNTGTLSQPKGHRWYAATYDLLNRPMERRVLSRLRPLVAGRATGQVLEIGAGTGANFPYYNRETVKRIVATEPDPFMLRRAQKRAAELELNIELHQCPAEALPFADASFDTVVCTLVLCTVADQARSLAEIKRVLKPDGAFRFLEHVRAEGVVGWVQDVVTPAWRWFGAGCHPNRRTAERIVTAGFEIVELQEQRLPFLPLIIGVAKPRGRA